MRRARRSVLVAFPLLALSLVLLMPARSRSEGTLLARVDKVQPVMPAAPLVAEMDVVQELEKAWLVRLPETSAGRLAAAGLSHEIFDPGPGGTVLFLVSSSAPDDLDALRQVGAAWPLDGTTSLFATFDEQARERIPAHLHLKRLADRLDLTPTFRLAGRSAAIARLAPAVRLPAGSAIPEMVGQVSTQALADTIKKLQGFGTRYASVPSCNAAGAWLLDSFNALGLAAAPDYFGFGNGYEGSNVVATLPGRTTPAQIVLVGAHYDSTSTERLSQAPGADDNASGTAAVLELARVLSRYRFDFTIKFVAFSAEEWGLYGSRAFASTARYTNQRIVGVVNLDMIGYTDQLPEDLDLIVNPKSEWLANTFAAAANAYAPMPTVKLVNASWASSDHASFWDEGYSALCGIEDASPKNPNYHKPGDLFSTLNMDFETSVTRASLATIAALAQPFVEPQPPANVTVDVQLLRSMFMRAKTAYVTWTPAPGAAGYNVYRAAVSRGPYTRMNRTLVAGTTFLDRLLPFNAVYFYVVSAVDANGNEGNYSMEATVR